MCWGGGLPILKAIRHCGMEYKGWFEDFGGGGKGIYVCKLMCMHFQALRSPELGRAWDVWVE